MKTAKIILRNVVSNWAGMFTSVLVSFFMTPFVIGTLGNAAYGFWVVLQSLTSYMFLLDFGVRSSLNRHIARYYVQRDHQQANRVVNTGLLVYVLVCGLVVVFSLLLGIKFESFFPFREIDPTTVFWAVLLVGSSVGLYFPSAVFDAVLTGLQRYDLMNTSQILSLLVRTALILFALKLEYGLLGISLATFLGSLVNLALTYVFAVRIYPDLRINFCLSDLGTFKLLSNYSLYAFILIGATRIITDAGNIIVGLFVGAASVTFYAIAGSLTSYATSVISGISTTISPAASSLEAEGDDEGLQALCIVGTKFVLLAGLPILLTFVISGKTFLSLWVGESFHASYPPLVLLSLGWIFNYLQSAAACVLMGVSRHKTAACLVLVQSVLNLAISVALVRKMGMLGVAWGSLIASVPMNLAFLAHALRVLRVSKERFVVQAVMPAIVALTPFAAALMFLSSQFPPTGLLTYFLQVALALSGMLILLPWSGLNPCERAIVRSSLSRWREIAGLSPS